MITSISVASYCIRIEWGNGRWQEADISAELTAGGYPTIRVKPYNLSPCVFVINHYEFLAKGDPDSDAYTFIAKAVIEYLTTGRHMVRSNVAILTEGPIQGIGRIDGLAAIMRDLVTSLTPPQLR